MDTQPQENSQNTGSAPQANPAQSAAPTPQSGAGDNRMLMGILAYLSILVLIPLLVEKNDPFVRYHVRQGLVLLVLEVGLMLLTGMLMLYSVGKILNIGLVILSILGIVNVVQNKQEPIPLVGQFSKYFEKV